MYFCACIPVCLKFFCLINTAWNVWKYGFSQPIFSRLEQNLRFCPYTGECRSVKNHILAHFMQCEVKNVCKKKQKYSYFCYILFFQFALINNQSNATFQAFALITCVNFSFALKDVPLTMRVRVYIISLYHVPCCTWWSLIGNYVVNNLFQFHA